MQPTIRPLFDTRQFQDCLLKWTGSDKSYHEYIKETWSGSIPSWNTALHDGVFKATSPVEIGASEASGSINVATAASELARPSENNGMELTLYTKPSMGDGQQANNPWLQEMPDPLTRASWDNYLTISKADDPQGANQALV